MVFFYDFYYHSITYATTTYDVGRILKSNNEPKLNQRRTQREVEVTKTMKEKEKRSCFNKLSCVIVVVYYIILSLFLYNDYYTMKNNQNLQQINI